MKKIRLFIRQFFDFSEKEVNGFVVLIFIIFALLLAPVVFRYAIPTVKANANSDQKILDSLAAQMELTDVVSVETKHSYFKFNPNNAVHEAFIKLGFTTYLADRIIKYRSKGGKFKTKSDLKKIYGFPESLYSELEPFIALPDSSGKPQSNTYKKTYTSQSYTKAIVQFDINAADSNQLEKVYGIGFKTAIRIIKYRDKLGGFVSMDQLYEVWKLDSAVVKELKLKAKVADGFIPLKININTAVYEELKEHPYIGYKFAKVILAYKQQHGGAIHGLQHLKEIKIITENDLQKMDPYLDFQ